MKAIGFSIAIGSVFIGSAIVILRRDLTEGENFTACIFLIIFLIGLCVA